MYAKAARSGADAIVIDLEDATPEESKTAARTSAVEAARQWDKSAASLWLRVNSPRSPHLADDFAAYRDGPFDGVVVPKVETVGEVERVEGLLAGSPVRGAILWGIETVAGVHRVEEILAASPSARGVYFGAEDLVADLGGRRTTSSRETLYARSRVVMAARLRGVFAIDQAFLGLDDAAGFIADASDGLDLGYDGKSCIHPDQAALTRSVYEPDADDVQRASRLLECFAEALSRGRATARFENAMIDAPIVAQARAVVERARDGQVQA